MEQDPRRVLVRAPNPLGDAIMAIPAMAAMRAAFTGRTLVLAAAPAIAPLFRERTAVAPDEILVVEKSNEAAALRAAGIDAAILFTNSFRTAWVARQAGIPDRWGYRAHGRSLLLTRGVRRPRGKRHQADYYRHLVQALGFDAPEALPRIEIGAPARARAAEHLQRAGVGEGAAIVGMAPGAAYGHAKRWPPARYAELIARLGGDGVTSILVGAAGDREAGREIESSLPAGVRVLNLIGRTDLRLLMGLLTRCRAFVSNDSGAMHLAAAAGVPVVAIFGPTDERVTAPLGSHDVILHPVFCRPCLLRDCPIDHRCMRRIGLDRVLEAVRGRLDRPAGTAQETRPDTMRPPHADGSGGVTADPAP